MPEDEYRWLPRADILSFEELGRVVDAFLETGVDGLRLTGGEPLLRRDVPALVRILAEKERVRDLSLTTNGLLLDEHAPALAAAGLHRLTISLDTLDPARFRALTRRDELARTLRGIDAAVAACFRGTKLNAVVMRGVNDGELEHLLAFGRERGLEVRFIEYMDVGGATRWDMAEVVPRAEILARLERALGPIEELPAPDERARAAPAERFRLSDGTVFGIIASTTAPFCGACDRSRLTADGLWYRCLYAAAGTDLRAALRGRAGPEALQQLVAGLWRARTDRGAEERLALPDRGGFVSRESLRRDPHLEMHTRGG
jgi:cyclic pyranopterin phosphate synthase